MDGRAGGLPFGAATAAQPHAGRRELTNPDNARIALTGAEFDLLRVLCERPGRVLSRDVLLVAVAVAEGAKAAVAINKAFLRRDGLCD